MLDPYDKLQGKVGNLGPVLDQLSAVDGLWNISRFDIPKLLDDTDNIRDSLQAEVQLSALARQPRVRRIRPA